MVETSDKLFHALAFLLGAGVEFRPLENHVLPDLEEVVELSQDNLVGVVLAVCNVCGCLILPLRPRLESRVASKLVGPRADWLDLRPFETAQSSGAIRAIHQAS